MEVKAFPGNLWKLEHLVHENSEIHSVSTKLMEFSECYISKRRTEQALDKFSNGQTFLSMTLFKQRLVFQKFCDIHSM